MDSSAPRLAATLGEVIGGGDGVHARSTRQPGKCCANTRAQHCTEIVGRLAELASAEHAVSTQPEKGVRGRDGS